MTYANVDLLFSALGQFPQGATAKVIAARLGLPASRVSSRLGKLAMYDVIDRVPNPEGRRNEFRYSIRRQA